MKNHSTIFTLLPRGFSCDLVEVECDITRGLPGLHIVGLGSRAVSEARERLKSSINNSGYQFPPRRVTINLAPAELPKDSSLLDLPMAISILNTSGQLNNSCLENCLFVGELSLDGSLRPIRGAISIAEQAQRLGFKKLFLPLRNLPQAKVFPGIEIIGAKTLEEIVLHLIGELDLEQVYDNICLRKRSEPQLDTPETPISICDIIGQTQAKRALEIAAAGGHNLLLTGPPGTGKTMLARALSELLPPLGLQESIEVTKLHTLAGVQIEKLISRRPFRNPHHSASSKAILGGGIHNKPGEVSLAHRGILFLDELLEFSRPVVEALRQPLEDRVITISRASLTTTYPADFILVATTNPCPCGFLGDRQQSCQCSPGQIQKYRSKLSGPILDRFDLQVEVHRQSNQQLAEQNTLRNSLQNEYKKRIQLARNAQNNRYSSCKFLNDNLTSSDINKFIQITEKAKALLNSYSDKFSLSARSYLKVIKVARTIADLTAEEIIDVEHISEALQYRPSPHPTG